MNTMTASLLAEHITEVGVATPEDRQRYENDVVVVLDKGYNITFAGALRGALLFSMNFRDDATRSYAIMSVNDNGGEFGVGPVNGESRYVPYTEHRRVINAATAAYRIAMAMRGESIDYSLRLDDDFADVLRGEQNALHNAAR
jgi:hypothetical protein